MAERIPHIMPKHPVQIMVNRVGIHTDVAQKVVDALHEEGWYLVSRPVLERYPDFYQTWMPYHETFKLTGYCNDTILTITRSVAKEQLEMAKDSEDLIKHVKLSLSHEYLIKGLGKLLHLDGLDDEEHNDEEHST